MPNSSHWIFHETQEKQNADHIEGAWLGSTAMEHFHHPLGYGAVAKVTELNDMTIQSFSLEEEMATHSSILAWKIPHGQRSLVGYSLWSCRKLDTTEWLSMHQNFWMMLGTRYNSVQLYTLFICCPKVFILLGSGSTQSWLTGWTPG